MKPFIITYVSYRTYKDREVYYDRAQALRRYEQLRNCPNVSKLKMEGGE